MPSNREQMICIRDRSAHDAKGIKKKANGDRARENDSLCYRYCLSGTLHFAGSADDACIVVDDYGLLSFVAFHFLKLENRDGTHINADGVAVAFLVVNHYTDHDLTPLEVEAVRPRTK